VPVLLFFRKFLNTLSRDSPSTTHTHTLSLIKDINSSSNDDFQ
jgi:hypothetical protein